jgi:hypothetical protein
MDILIGIVITLFVLGLIGHFFGDDSGGSGADVGELRMRVREMQDRNEETGYEYPAFEIQVRGGVPVAADGSPVEFRVHLYDGPEDNLMPVLCSLSQLQEHETEAFEWRSEVIAMPIQNGLSEWTTMLTVPKEVLVFPASGERRMGFQFSAIAANNPPHFEYGFTDGSTGLMYAVCSTTRQYENQDEGYQDGPENRRITLHAAIELSLHMAGLGGEVGRPEAEVVKKWMASVVEGMPEEIRKAEKSEMGAVAKRAFNAAVNGESEIAPIVTRMNGAASQQEKYNALELCMDVMAADGKAEAAEMEALDRIANMLRVDNQAYRELREQRIAKLSDVEEVSDNLNTMLGITPEMTPDEVRSHLSAEYRKWNSRVGHADEKIRSRAEQMLLLIGDARSKFVD